MRRLQLVLVAGALFVGGAACTDGDGASSSTTTIAAADRSGCPVEPASVGALLGYDVIVEEDGATASACRFVPVSPGTHPGAHVLVVERRLAAGGGLGAVRDAVETAVGPVEPLPDGVLEGADGWVARVGRVVQVAAAEGRSLVQVTVADATLEPTVVEAAALDLAAQALGNGGR